jgi:hypothetical protein
LKTKTAILVVVCCIGSFFSGYTMGPEMQAEKIRRLSEDNRKLQQNIALLRLPLMTYLFTFGELTEDDVNSFLSGSVRGASDENLGRFGPI